MNVVQRIQKIIRSLGYDVKRFHPNSDSLARRRHLLKSYEIDVVLDVGANKGQFAQQLRNDLDYSNKIISFEPLSSAFKILEINAKKDSHWDVFNFALGDVETKREINIAGNSYSSSFLNMLPLLLKTAPEAKYVGKEIIEIKRLDSIFEKLCPIGGKIYLKIDTQGFESRVIKGAESSLFNIDTIQLEMSLVSLYDNELLFDEMYSLMKKKGYSLVSIESGFIDEASGQLLQVDGIFHRL